MREKLIFVLTLKTFVQKQAHSGVDAWCNLHFVLRIHSEYAGSLN